MNDKITEEQLREKEKQLLVERQALEIKMKEIKEDLISVRKKLTPFSQDQKRQEKRLVNGVDARKLANTEAAFARAKEASSLRAQGKSWPQVGDAMGITGNRARQLAIGLPALERAIQKRSGC